MSSKLEALVKFETIQLDMKPYVSSENKSPSTQYNLKSVICHSGGIHTGSYYALGKRGTSWHKFINKHISDHDPRAVVTEDAYILLYELYMLN